ncbi:MAG: hypothetical protein IPL78_30190 [Chloroflexi bacterium]|nr:hypothetical protein [Chloroflexota bacterium]
MVRRQALQFQGAATTGARIARLVLSWLRLGLFVVALVFLYDLIHHHANSLVQRLHAWLGPVADAAEAIPPYELDIGITILLGLLLLVIFVSRVRSITSQKTLRCRMAAGPIIGAIQFNRRSSGMVGPGYRLCPEAS